MRYAGTRGWAEVVSEDISVINTCSQNEYDTVYSSHCMTMMLLDLTQRVK